MIQALINRLFPSVDGLVASIRKTAERLEKHSLKTHDKAARIEQRADAFLAEAAKLHASSIAIADDATSEAIRAGIQADKLRTLLV